MIERAWDAQPGVNASVIVLRNPRYPLWLHESDELIPARVKKDVPDLAPFGNLDDVTASHLEPQDVLVEVTRAVQVPCRQPDMRKSLCAMTSLSFSGASVPLVLCPRPTTITSGMWS